MLEFTEFNRKKDRLSRAIEQFCFECNIAVLSIVEFNTNDRKTWNVREKMNTADMIILSLICVEQRAARDIKYFYNRGIKFLFYEN